MRIPLNHDSTTPLYKQIQQYFQDQIRCGGLATDTRLPASRDLATSLGVSRLTVSNAYDELEALGYIYSVRGSGTFVAAVPNTIWGYKRRLPGWELGILAVRIGVLNMGFGFIDA